jgi:hypothetical protein
MLAQREAGKLVIGAVEIGRYDLDRVEEVLGPCLQIGTYIVLGIENDCRYQDWDQYERQIHDLIKDHITPNAESSLDIEAVQVGDRTLALITINRDSSRWCYLNNERFYVRLGNRTRALTGREADDYKAEWMGRTV